MKTTRTLTDTVSKLNDLTQTLSAQSDNIEQVLHVAGPGISNFYNIYDPAQGTLNGLLSIPEFANPFNLSAVDPLKLPPGQVRPTTSSAPSSVVSGWVRCCAGYRQTIRQSCSTRSTRSPRTRVRSSTTLRLPKPSRQLRFRS